MAEAAKALGQKTNVSANTDVDLYTVPGSTSAVVSTLTIASLEATASRTFQVRIRVAGAATNDKQFLAKNMTIEAGNTIILTLGITLATTDVVTVQDSSTNLVAYNLFGVEIT